MMCSRRVVGSIVAICIAVIFGIALRWQWVAIAEVSQDYQWNGAVQPTTPDALWHAVSIKHHGVEAIDHIPWLPALPDLDGMVHVLGVAALQLLPISLDQLMLWGPMLLGSLLAVPLVLIGRQMGSTAMGFGAALLAVAAPAYYQRTMAGSWDHDMLSVTAMALIIWAGMASVSRPTTLRLSVLSLLIMVFPFVYARGLAILGLAVFVMAVVELIRRRGNGVAWRFTAIIAMAAAVSPLSMGNWLGQHPVLWLLVVCGLIVAVAVVNHRRVPVWLVITGLGAAVVVGVAILPWNIVMAQLELYLGIPRGDGRLASGAIAAIDHDLIHGRSILEMQPASLPLLGRQILGLWPLSLVAFIGWLAACRKYPRAWMMASLVLFGLFSIVGGIRFAQWGVVPAAIGLSWLVFQVAARCVGSQPMNRTHVLRTTLAMVMRLVVLLPSVVAALTFPGRTVLTRGEIAGLKSLKQHSSPEDIVATWWDWGTAVALYADRHALLHPGRMTDDVLLISRMLASDSPTEAASLARALAGTIGDGRRPAVHAMLDHVGGEDSPARVGALISSARAGSLEVVPVSRDVWMYLPIETAAYVDPIAEYGQAASVSSSPLRTVLGEGMVEMADGRWMHPKLKLIVDPHGGHTYLQLPDGREQEVQFQTVTVVTVDQDGRTHAPTRPGSGELRVRLTDTGVLAADDSPHDARSLHLILLPQAKTMLLANDSAVRTNAVQMGVLGQYDSDLFEQVHAAPRVRVYRVRQADEMERGP